MLEALVIGNLGNDPELQYAASGTAFLRFNVACNGRERVNGEWQDRTEWMRVTVLGKRAESLQGKLTKGQRVFVSGRLEARPWTDQQGNVRAGLEVVADKLEWFGARDAAPAREGEWKPMQTPSRPAVQDAELEELPF